MCVVTTDTLEEGPTRVKGVASGDGVGAFLLILSMLLIFFFCTKKYPILLFFFDKRVRTGDIKNENLQCIENQGFEKNFMFLQTTEWVGLGLEIKL